MSLNKAKGNMYPWLDYTWNPIRGECPHQCVYCYMRGRWGGPLRIDEKALNANLGSGRTIFVGSSTDMWADKVPDSWIQAVLRHCREYPGNTYLFQTKNPRRFNSRTLLFPPDTILGTTIETNRSEYAHSHAPDPLFRMSAMLRAAELWSFPRMVSIEPILDFDVDVMLDWMRAIMPRFVSIGADSKRHHLREPSRDKLRALVNALSTFTEVRIKSNLTRLCEKGGYHERTRAEDEGTTMHLDRGLHRLQVD